MDQIEFYFELRKVMTEKMVHPLWKQFAALQAAEPSEDELADQMEAAALLQKELLPDLQRRLSLLPLLRSFMLSEVPDSAPATACELERCVLLAATRMAAPHHQHLLGQFRRQDASLPALRRILTPLMHARGLLLKEPELLAAVEKYLQSGELAACVGVSAESFAAVLGLIEESVGAWMHFESPRATNLDWIRDLAAEARAAPPDYSHLHAPKQQAASGVRKPRFSGPASSSSQASDSSASSVASDYSTSSPAQGRTCREQTLSGMQPKPHMT